MTPNHEAFRYCYLICQKTGGDVYDYLPDGQARYPFIYVGENNTPQGETVKDEASGLIRQNIHLYSTTKQRSQINELATIIHDLLKTNKGLGTYFFKPRELSIETITDNSTAQPLLHVVVSVLFHYSK